MRGAELYRNFVPPRSPVLRRESLGLESEDFYISIDSAYWAFEGGLLCVGNWFIQFFYWCWA